MTCLQVAIDDVALVKILQRQSYFGSIELGSRFGKDAIARKMKEQLEEGGETETDTQIRLKIK